MKNLKPLLAAVFSFFVLQTSAQTEVPKGFSNGKITMLDNSEMTGLIKENIRRNASLVMLIEGKEKKFDGADIAAFELGANQYICIKGDFFKVVCRGELTFLQKSSNASSKPTYVGNNVFFVSGTDGKPGDYFLFQNQGQQLKLVSKKNFEEVIADSFAGYAPAIEKAKSAQTDIAQLKDAVVLFNNRGEK